VGLVIAVLLAIFVLHEPWSWVAVVVGGAWEVGETVLLVRWSQRRRSAVGAGALVGRRAVAATDCMPEGQVRVAGELWRAQCRGGARSGDEVIVCQVDGLTLVVEPPELPGERRTLTAKIE
jgi:membrane protein implicated in regulation of membrane protease activity